MPPSACSNLPAALVDRPGERAALVAEELALDEFPGQRGAVDLDEGPQPPRASCDVDRARHQLLAGAVLAGDQDAPRAGGGEGDPAAQLDDHRVLADDLDRGFGLAQQLAVLARQPALLEGVAQHQQGLLEREGLLDEVVGPELRRAHRGLDGAVSGHHDDRDGRPALR